MAGQEGTRAFKITELGGNKLTFVWDAKHHSAPRGSWKGGLKQRTNREDYVGSLVPSEQVLGGSYKPFTLSGVWDDRHNGIGYAWREFNLFNALVLRGNKCRFEFEELQFEGLITEWDFEYTRKNYIGYSFTVSAHTRDEVEAFEGPVDFQTPVEYVAQISGIEMTRSSLPLEKTLDDDLRDYLADINGHIKTAQNLIDTRFKQVEGTIDATNRLAHVLTNVKNTARSVLTRTASLQSDTGLTYNTAKSALDFEAYRHTLNLQARQMAYAAMRGEYRLKRMVKPNIRAIYVPYEGESFYSVSQKFYGTPHAWRLITERNGIQYYPFRGTETLVIPERP